MIVGCMPHVEAGIYINQLHIVKKGTFTSDIHP